MLKRFSVILLLVTLLVTLVPVGQVQAQEYELVDLRTETGKVYWIEEGVKKIEISTGPIHYKDNYSNLNEPWKDIDTTIVFGEVTKTPYELTIDTFNKSFTVRDKRTGAVTTIGLDSISSKLSPVSLSPVKPVVEGNKVTWIDIVDGIDLVIEAGGTWVKFSRIIKNEHAAQLATFTIEGKGVIYRAYDKNAMPVELQLEVVGNKVTESFTAKADQYPITIDPTYQIGASSDDAAGRYGLTYWSTAWTIDAAGAHGSHYKYYSGMRYLNIPIANAAAISSAKITFTCHTAYSGTDCLTRISADDTDDAATFSTQDNYTTRWGTRTTARVDWDNIAAWALDTEYDSPNIASVIQELVDIPGWASGQAMAIFWDDLDDRSTHLDGNCRFSHSYDSDSSKDPVLTIVVGGPPSVTSENATDIDHSSGTLHGNVTAIADTNIIERGFEWDTDSGVPYAYNWTETGTWGTGGFSHELTGLSQYTTIYYRALAKNDDVASFGYGAELNFTTPWAPPDPPGNFTLTSLGGSLVAINWTKAVDANADTTLVIGKSGSYPTDREDGWVAYNSSANNTTDNRGLSFNLEQPYYSAWSYNASSGFSTTYAQNTTGGEGMNNLTTFLVFPGMIGMSLLFIAIIPRKKNLLLSLGAAIFWFAMFFWWMKGEALQGLGFEGDIVIYLVYIPLIFFFVILIEYIINCNKAEIKRVQGGREWTDWGTPPEERGSTPAQDYRKELRRRIGR